MLVAVEKNELMKLVLLPGMDGTGLLFGPLLDALPDSIDTEVICYSTTNQQTYSELVEEVKSKLPTEPFVLLAESFSGTIAFQLSLDISIPIKKLILVASFLDNPLPKLGGVVRMLPLQLILKIPIPKFVLKTFCFQRQSRDELLSLFYRSIGSVDSKVLAFRIRQILTLTRPSIQSGVDCLIVLASKDRLISEDISVAIKQHFISVKYEQIDGPHFLAQEKVKDLILMIKNNLILA